MNYMRMQYVPQSCRSYVLILAFVVIAFLPNHARAQVALAGNKAVYGTSGVTFSKVWIDASAFWVSFPPAPDLCAIINSILTTNYTQNYPDGAVIDARGLIYPGAHPGSQQFLPCTIDPFQGVTSTSPSTILLPAAVIQIAETWHLPNNTKIIGEGPWTSIQALTSFSGSYMIEMGSSASCPAEGCSGVGIELLLLDASQNAGVGGIHNQYSQTPSYVNNVNLHKFSLTGLRVEGPTLGGAPGAIDSGPYTNITFSTNFAASCSGSTCPVCVDIEAQTRGLHGLTCIGSPNTGEFLGQLNNAAVYINASNNSVEDVHVEAFWNGIEVGNTTSSVGNVIVSNVTGSASQDADTCKVNNNNYCRVINTVHICGPNFNGQSGPCSVTTGTVSDVTVLQAADLDNAPPPKTTSVQDDVTGTTQVRLTGSPPTTTGMYVLGEALGGNAARTRFAVSPAPTGNFDSSSSVVPTWGVGIVNAATLPCSTPGALYSNTTGGTGNAVLVCTGSSPTFTWQSIP